MGYVAAAPEEPGPERAAEVDDGPPVADVARTDDEMLRDVQAECATGMTEAVQALRCWEDVHS